MYVAVIWLLSHVWLFETPWIAACQAPLSSIISHSFLKFMSIESVMLSNHLILACPLLLLPSVFPRIRVFSNESALHIRWPKYWSISFSISSSNEYSGLISFRIHTYLSNKMMLWKCCTQYASKFGKLSSGHRIGKGQFSFQLKRKAMQKNAQTIAQLHSSHMPVK